MDLHEFNDYTMYFNEKNSESVDELVRKASESYPDASAEGFLTQALELEPNNMSVLIGFYRYYFYRHKYNEAVVYSDKILSLCAQKLGWKISWQDINLQNVAGAVLEHSMSLVRLYLTTLKCSGYIHVRLGEISEGIKMMEKVIELDKHDRLATKSLLATVRSHFAQLDASVTRYATEQQPERAIEFNKISISA